MSYGWCRPCSSWGGFDGQGFDGQSFDGYNETMTNTLGAGTIDSSPYSSGDPGLMSTSQGDTTLTLSSISQGMISGLVENNMTSHHHNKNNPENRASYDANSTNDDATTTLKIIECDNPYKIEYFERQLFLHEPSESRRNMVLNALRELGVKAYIVDEMAIKNTSDVIDHVQHIIRSIEQDTTTVIASSTLGPQRCLLYQDHQSRLFNLVLSSKSEGPKRRWEEYLESFSTLRAMSAFVLLLRSLPGLFLKAESPNHRPLYLAIIVGLILTEETSLAGANMGILVRHTPTHCALALKDPPTMHHDAIRKVCIMSLVLAASAEGWTQTSFTAIGVILSGLLLLVNLGARAWYFMDFGTINRDRIGGSAVMPFLLSFFTGLSLTFMSSRISASGGKRAIEHIIFSIVWIGLVMVLSATDRFLKLVVIETTVYDQTMVNLFLGSWWIASSLCSLCFAICRKCEVTVPDGEHFLTVDDSSPTGFRVPSLPRFEINERLAATRRVHRATTSHAEFVTALLVVIIVAAAMVVLLFTKVGETLV